MMPLLVAVLSLLLWQERQDLPVGTHLPGLVPSVTVQEEVDRWIERLPPIEQEGHYDAEQRKWVCAPEVEALRSYLDVDRPMTDARWRLALERSRAIRVRERWPVEEPLAVSVEQPTWLRNVSLSVTPRLEGFEVARSAGSSHCGNCSSSMKFRARYQPLGRIALGPQLLELEVSIDRDPVRRVKGEPGEGNLWRGVLSFSVVGVPSCEEALPGAHDAALDAAVRRALDIGLYEERLGVTGDVDTVPELNDTAVSLVVEVRKGSEVLAQDARPIYQRPGFVSQSLELDAPDSSLTGWNLHVLGVADGTLREWNARRYWNGEIVIPLDELR